MPLLIHVPVFGIIQLGLGLQFSIFPVIGLMKVRKAGSMTIMGIFIALFLVMMFPPMALIAVCAVVVELLVFAIFRSYKNDWACVMAGTLYMPLTVPLLYLYYNVNYTVTGAENEAVSMFLGATDPWVIVGMTAAIVALCFVGSVIGMIISRFFRFKTKLYPLIAITASLFVIIFGLVAARNENLCWYLLGVLAWLCIFGCFKGVLKMLPAFVVFGGAFAGIAYASAGGDFAAALSMLNRFGALFLGVALSMSVAAVRMTRSLSQVHTPRAITLGMLISMSFVPMLKGEIGRVREAMKTRGAGSVLNPKILYRAFLVPFVMRLVNISDTLALSVETRGFTLGGSLYSIYKKEYPALSDVLFIFGIVAGAVLVVVL